jgi:uncharacterized protein (DUF2249 family)
MTSAHENQEALTTDPILASWKISEVLHHYPQLLDVLIDLSPAFAKLRNPLMRRVQSRLVTVAQAAGIAGIDPAALTRKLNQAAGITPSDDTADNASEPVTSPRTAPEWTTSAPIAQELDVRPLMESGVEPFRVIMESARHVPAGSRLRLIVGFEPLPLYDALAKQGFSNWPTQLDDTSWQVDFRRKQVLSRPSATQAAQVDWNAPAAEVTIDVSELVPPEPMVKILQTLETLPQDSRLLVHHVRRPIHLYDRLDEMGYAYDTRDIAPGKVQVMIQKPPLNGESS